MSKKFILVLAVIVGAILLVAGYAYYRSRQLPICISYYGEDKTTLLYQECE